MIRKKCFVHFWQLCRRRCKQANHGIVNRGQLFAMSFSWSRCDFLNIFCGSHLAWLLRDFKFSDTASSAEGSVFNVYITRSWSAYPLPPYVHSVRAWPQVKRIFSIGVMYIKTHRHFDISDCVDTICTALGILCP